MDSLALSNASYTKYLATSDKVASLGFDYFGGRQFSLVTNSELGGPTGFLTSDSDFDVFEKLFKEDLVMQLYDINKDHCEILNHHPSRLFRYYAQKMRIYSHQKDLATVRDHFPMTADLPGSFGYEWFMSIHSKVRADRASFELASDILTDHWIAGEYVCIDEKHYPFKGNSPYKRFVSNKKPPWGHWVTEVCVKGPKTGLTYVLKMIPFMDKSWPMKKLLLTCLRGVLHGEGKKPIAVADAYYPDTAIVEYWTQPDTKQPFLMSMNEKRLAYLWKILDKSVTTPGHWSYLHNSARELTAITEWRKDQIGKSHLITNAFSLSVPDSTHMAAPMNKESLPSQVYKKWFGACDKVNNHLYYHKWRYRRTYWGCNFESIFFELILASWYAATTENSLPSSSSVLPDFDSLLENLSEKYMEYALSLSDEYLLSKYRK